MDFAICTGNRFSALSGGLRPSLPAYYLLVCSVLAQIEPRRGMWGLPVPEFHEVGGWEGGGCRRLRVLEQQLPQAAFPRPRQPPTSMLAQPKGKGRTETGT